MSQSMNESCERCGTTCIHVPDFAGNSIEVVCPKCGILKQNLDLLMPSIGNEITPTSKGVLGDNLGTNYSTRNKDGSSNIYELRGNNGKFKPVVISIREWNLVGLEEPNPVLRKLKESLADSLQCLEPDEIARIIEPIVNTATKVQDDLEHFRIDAESSFMKNKLLVKIGSDQYGMRFTKEELKTKLTLLKHIRSNVTREK